MNRGFLKAFIIVPFILIDVMADTGVIMLTPKDSIRRTEWESMGGGWTPPPAPPKIILLKSQESSSEGDKKEDKIEMLLPIIMTLGPIILIAILMPIFMSLLSGIMGFVKSLLSMKMMPMMPVNMLNGNMLPAGIQQIPLIQKYGMFSGRNQNSTLLERFLMKADDMIMSRNMTALDFPGF